MMTNETRVVPVELLEECAELLSAHDSGGGSREGLQFRICAPYSTSSPVNDVTGQEVSESATTLTVAQFARAAGKYATPSPPRRRWMKRPSSRHGEKSKLIH
jgi:hypothetical protein